MSASYTRGLTPTEARLLVRHRYKFYTNLVVGAIYQCPKTTTNDKLSQAATYIPALRTCLDQHPFLSMIVGRKDTVDFLALADRIDIQNHVLVHEMPGGGLDEDVQIGRMIERLTNDPDLTFFDSIMTRPGWRVDILPLDSNNDLQRVWIAFTYAHCTGDGRSGVIFHESFFKAFRDDLNNPSGRIDDMYTPKQTELFALPKLSVSLTYLLGPALGHYLPKFLSSFFGLKASSSGSDEKSWTGPLTFLNNEASLPKAVTAVEVFTVSSVLLSQVLRACRARGTKLTSLLNILIAQCMSRNLPRFIVLGADKDNFIATIPTNIRRLTKIPDHTIGNFSSAAYSRHAIDRSLSTQSDFNITDSHWFEAAQNSRMLAQQTSSLMNQPIGLLSWISDLDGWMKDQIGKPRDSSWQLSNIMALTTDFNKSEVNLLKVEKLYFCQPADAVGQPLDFNTASIVGGDLVICVGWQVGAMGLDTKQGHSIEDVERQFVSSLLRDLTRYLEAAVR